MRRLLVLLGAVGVFLVLAIAVSDAGSARRAPAAAASQTPAAASGVTPQGVVLGQGSRQVGDLTVWLTALLKSPARGQNVIEALIVDGKGQQVNDATVSFDLDMTNMSHGKNVVQAPRVGDGRYDGTVSFMMPGPWRIIATIERGGKAVGSARFDFSVNLR